DGGAHSFSYDPDNRLTAETFGGLQNEWSYTSGSATGLTWGSSSSPSVTSLSPAVLSGLAALADGAPLATQTAPDSHKTTSTMDNQGRLLTRTNPDGGQLTDTYANGYLAGSTDEDGRTTSYARDGSGYVTLETFPDSSTQQYAYQGLDHALTTFTD